MVMSNVVASTLANALNIARASSLIGFPALLSTKPR
jgi:hypothetical protein